MRSGVWLTSIAICAAMAGSLQAQASIPDPAAAQDSANTAPAVIAAPVVAPTAESDAPIVFGARSAVQRPIAADAPAPMPSWFHSRQLPKPKTLMIIGGVGFVAGAFIGGVPGTLLLAASGVTGLYGVYVWAQK